VNSPSEKDKPKEGAFAWEIVAISFAVAALGFLGVLCWPFFAIAGIMSLAGEEEAFLWWTMAYPIPYFASLIAAVFLFDKRLATGGLVILVVPPLVPAILGTLWWLTE